MTAIQNYTSQILDPEMPAWLRAQAAKFVVHFVGDIHQPLHDEDVARGGNGIHVLWNGHELNLHHVWDSSIAERWVGGVRRKPYNEAQKWASELTAKITDGDFKAESTNWLDGVDFEDPIGTALGWAREGNAYVCSHGKLVSSIQFGISITVFEGVDKMQGQMLQRAPPPPKKKKILSAFDALVHASPVVFSALNMLVTLLTIRAVFPEGPAAIVGQELSGEYYDKAAPVIEVQVARAGYRLAAWLDLIVAASKTTTITEDEL